MSSHLMLATFHLGDTLWGVDVLHVREVLNRTDCTPVPHSEPHVLGLMNLRGHIVTVVDFAARIGCDAVVENNGGMCVVLRSSSELARVERQGRDLEDPGPDSVALRVDRMGRMVEIATDEIISAPANVDRDFLEYVKGVVRLDGELVLVLRLANVLAA